MMKPCKAQKFPTRPAISFPTTFSEEKWKNRENGGKWGEGWKWGKWGKEGWGIGKMGGMGKMLREGENWGNKLEKARSNRSPAFGHGVGRYQGSLLSTQPLAGVSSPTGPIVPSY